MNGPHLHQNHEHCHELIEQLNGYLDGELSIELCAELDEHLRECPDCRVILDTLSQTIRIMRGVEPLPAPLPVAVEQRLLQRLGLAAPAPSSPEQADNG